MKIISDDKKAEIEIVRNDDADPYSGYWIGLRIQTVDGEYSGANGCVHFSAFDRFLSRFREFVRTRQGDVVLEMTEGCSLVFFRWNDKAEVAVRAMISKFKCGYDPIRTTPVTVSGTFKIDSEFISSIEEEFTRIKASEPDAGGYSPEDGRKTSA